MPTRKPEPLPAVEPAVDCLGGVAGQRRSARLVTLPVEHAERAAGEVEILRVEPERLGDAKPAPEQDRQEGAISDAGRRAPRTGGAKRFDLSESEGLGGESAGWLSLHTASDGLRARPVSLFFRSDTLWPLRARPAECSREKRHSLAEWGWAPGDWLTA